MDTVEIVAGEWRSGPVLVARSFMERWQGLRTHPAGRAMVLRTRSVTTMGMQRPIVWMALDRSKTIIGAGVARPGRIVFIRGAEHIVEFAVGRDLPPVGTSVSIVDRCPED